MAPLPGDDPSKPLRPELPPVPRDHPVVGYRRSFQWEERLHGLVLVIVGLLGLTLVTLGMSGGLPGGPAPPEPPPGLRNLPTLPIVNPLGCIVPMIGIGSVGLVLVGLRRMFDP